MSMIGGTVTVNDDETHSGSGLAVAIYVGFKAAFSSDLPPIDTSQPAFAQDLVKKSRLAILRGYAKMAVAIGPAVVSHIQANARVPLTSVVATVGTSTSVGRTPNPNDPDAPIQGPASSVPLPVTGPSGATELSVQ